MSIKHHRRVLNARMAAVEGIEQRFEQPLLRRRNMRNNLHPTLVRHACGEKLHSYGRRFARRLARDLIDHPWNQNADPRLRGGFARPMLRGKVLTGRGPRR